MTKLSKLIDEAISLSIEIRIFNFEKSGTITPIAPLATAVNERDENSKFGNIKDLYS